MGVHEQRPGQLIAPVQLLAELRQIGLGLVTIVVQLRPVVHQKYVGGRTFFTRLPPHLAQRFHELGERHAGIGKEAPSGLRRRERSARPRQRLHASSHRLHYIHVPLYQLQIPLLQPSIHTRKNESILLASNRNSEMCRYQWSGDPPTTQPGSLTNAT